MDAKYEISMLYDFYSGLIPASQQRVVELYINEDMSLAEVAELLSISRQGVSDSLSRAKNKLLDYERRLGLLAEFRERMKALDELRAAAEAIRGMTDDRGILSECDRIDDITDKLNEREERNGI